jgi:hypothetical protein
MPQVAPDRRNWTVWLEPLVPVEYKFNHGVQASRLSGHHGRGKLVLKRSVAKVGRSSDALEASIRWITTELGLL